MLVEDEAVSAAMTRRGLESSGYKVPAHVQSGEEAIQKARELQPDLVLMDISLSGVIDGIEAAGEISSSLSIPVVYLTASSGPQTLGRAKVTEPLGYLVKPFERDTLRTTVELALHRHEMQSRLKEQTQALEALYSVSRILAQPWSFEQKSQAALEAIAEMANADLVTLRVKDQGDDGMHLASTAGPAKWKRPDILPIDGSISGLAFRTGEPVVADDYRAHPLADKGAVSQGVASLASVPIRSGRLTLGVINLASRETDHFAPRVVSLLSSVADGLAAL